MNTYLTGEEMARLLTGFKDAHGRPANSDEQMAILTWAVEARARAEMVELALHHHLTILVRSKADDPRPELIVMHPAAQITEHMHQANANIQALGQALTFKAMAEGPRLPVPTRERNDETHSESGNPATTRRTSRKPVSRARSKAHPAVPATRSDRRPAAGSRRGRRPGHVPFNGGL